MSINQVAERDLLAVNIARMILLMNKYLNIKMAVGQEQVNVKFVINILL
jgi:hypothetical protein